MNPALLFAAGAADQNHSRVVCALLGVGDSHLVRIAAARWADSITLEWSTDPKTSHRLDLSAAQARCVAAELLASAEEIDAQARIDAELNESLTLACLADLAALDAKPTPNNLAAGSAA